MRKRKENKSYELPIGLNSDMLRPTFWGIGMLMPKRIDEKKENERKEKKIALQMCISLYNVNFIYRHKKINRQSK